MPSPRQCLTPHDVRRFVADRCLPDSGTGRVGVELELLSFPLADPTARPPAQDLLDAVASTSPPRRANLTLEPGGQVEVSSRVEPGLRAALEATRVDLAALRDGLAGRGIGTASFGVDPLRPHHRVVAGPRYDAMEAYFEGDGPPGRSMMCGTASVQVNLDLGPVDAARRWRLAHAIGPVLVGAFANSPFEAGRPTGARSRRQQVWAAMDPSRTAPVAGHHRRADPVEEWTAYALRARLMLIRACPDWFRPVVAPLPFGVWMARGHELGWPTLDDFAYHLTTLFPPVRPRGWLELRMVDAVPDPWWQVAVAVATTLLDDPAAFEVAERACAPVADRWAEAASAGLGHPGLAAAARQCFEAALDALPRLGADREAVTATEAYLERFVARGRCPADDLLDGWAAGGPAAVAGLLGEPAEADAGR